MVDGAVSREFHEETVGDLQIRLSAALKEAKTLQAERDAAEAEIAEGRTALRNACKAIELASQNLQALRIAARNLAVKMGGTYESETYGELVSEVMGFAHELHDAVNVSEGTVEKP